MKTPTAARGVDLTVKARLQTSDRRHDRPRLAAWAFSQGGRFLAKAPLDSEGEARLRLPAVSAATSVRVMVGPERAEAREGQSADLADLVRVGAVDSHVRVEPASRALAMDLHVLAPIWLPWLEGFCCVRGTLDKGWSNGVELPVCNALVEIYEVEPWWLIIRRIPADVLARLRDIVAGTVPPIHWPIPDPGPEAQRPLTLAQAAVAGGPAPRPLPAPAPLDFGPLKSVALRASALEFRSALVDQEWIIRPILCWLWPEFVTLHLLGTVATDQCGHFQYCFFKGFGVTGPTNLYFKAKVPFFFGGWIYIYEPTPVGCHTWWNYACGSEVNLVTTSPWAHACAPCLPVIAPDNWVMFTAIGNTSLSTVRGTGANLVASTTASNLGLTEGGAPWGGTLLPRLDFDDSLRDSLGVRFYQVSWRRGATGAFAPITVGDINRHYIYTPSGASNPVIAPYFLGPQTAGATQGLFEIPPAVPPPGPMGEVTQWTIADAVADTASAQFPTDVAGASPGVTYDGFGAPVGTDQSGLFQLQVQLFDAAGALIDIAAKGIKYVIPTSADLTQTITTADASTIAEPGGGSMVQGDALVITLNVNNNRCHAAINAPTIDGTAADDCCGVLHYAAGDSVALSWTAEQVGDFAWFNFDLYRGAYEVWADDGQTVGSALTVTTQSVATLMGPNASCDMTCTMAGFSQNLGVYALATDGWSRQSEYDAYAVWAFVLAAS